MSGFDENPFGEPTVDNPFADPAVQQATSGVSQAQRGLDDYNPFADQPQQPKPPQVRGAANPPQYQYPGTQNTVQPAIMQPTQETLPPAYARSGQQSQDPNVTAEFQRRQEELERKAEELARREEALKNAPYNVRQNNWPPLPQSCCFQPCFYQDINVDIPLEFQKVVRMLYYIWLYHGGVLLLNVIGGLILLFYDGKFVTFGLSIFYVFLYTPYSFLCWYRPAYKAFRDDSSFNFMVFFFMYFFQFLITMSHTIGFTSGGACGFIMAISVFNDGGTGAGHIIVGILVLIIALCFGAAACMDILLLTKVHAIYKSSGASFAKAQAEFATEFMKNEHVQGAAQQAATAAVRTQVNNMTSGGNRF
ncbi:Hypothetical predicted protein [Cloeon dipterum]|uniref:Secretory carrier-associated membrane protein n=1 Tax=Cloeon dipterum TaxID=197152 RepID=A0A8S1C5M3_9INSE|nr:Hypothetical predicted protein [Cloeon dipterum]